MSPAWLKKKKKKNLINRDTVGDPRPWGGSHSRRLTWFSRELWAPAGRWGVEERSLCSTWLLRTPTHSRTAAGMNGGAQFKRLDVPLDSYVAFYQSLHPTLRSGGFPLTRDVEEGENRRRRRRRSRDSHWQQLVFTDTSHASTHRNYCYQKYWIKSVHRFGAATPGIKSIKKKKKKPLYTKRKKDRKGKKKKAKASHIWEKTWKKHEARLPRSPPKTINNNQTDVFVSERERERWWEMDQTHLKCRKYLLQPESSKMQES